MYVALYCKSFSKDFPRLSVLIQSISKHNRDNLKLYLSVPSRDLEGARNLIKGTQAVLFSDEEIVGRELADSHITQQVVKLSFWKMAPEETIVMLDSDSYFIKDFYERSFIDSQGRPYTVMHQQKDYFQFAARLCANKGIDTGFAKKGFIRNRAAIRQAIGSLLDEHTLFDDFGPSPYIWSKQVLKSFYSEFLSEKNLTLEDCMAISASELSWYGEWLLYKRPIDLIPIEPLFKVYHVPQQYQEALKLHETETSLKENFYGIVLQSNWNAPFRFGGSGQNG